MKLIKKIENILVAQQVHFVEIPRKETWKLQQKWRETYAVNLYNKTGKWIHDDIDWHVFSHEHTAHVAGNKAWNKYREKCGNAYLILPNGNAGNGYRCESNKPANFSKRGIDLYICPEDMSWTFVNTHEEDWIGPFYSDKEMI